MTGLLRRNGRLPCKGPHPAGDNATRALDDLLCPRCWKQLPRETQRRLKLSGGSGRINPVVRFQELREQLAAGVPLSEIEVSP